MQYKSTICLLTFMLACFLLNSQVLETFSDGDFTNDPAWTGDESQFIITDDFMLRSAGNEITGSNAQIYLSTPSMLINNTQWEFFVNPRAATSSNNLMDVFLTSDSARLTGNNRGYFVRIGGTPDEVALFRKDGTGNPTYVIQGVSGLVSSSSTNPFRVKVLRETGGNWTLYADKGGSGTAYELVGTATDMTYTNTQYFGLVVRYSNANRERYFFDDIYVGEIIVDDIPPELLSIKVLDVNRVELLFSENVDPASAGDTEHYSANNGLGEPVSAQRSTTDHARVVLQFGPSFQEGLGNTLSVSGVRDIAGNPSPARQMGFLYYKAKPYDIVFNELMPDPDPPVMQPNVEYFELYNRTPYPVNLDGWLIVTGTTVRNLPDVTLHPDSFIVLTTVAGAALFGDSIAVAGVQGFSALTNSGATLTLRDRDETVIATVIYSDAWYGDATKRNGGWSLERVSPDMPCAGAGNWLASVSPTGGTPGKRNSVYSPVQDTEAPKIERVVITASDVLRVFFTESVQLSSFLDPQLYRINDGSVVSVLEVTAFPPDFRSVQLTLSANIEAGVDYQLTVLPDVKDCAGNPLNTTVKGRFAVPQPALSGDIVINEILSNPKDGGFDFVELYNRTNKIIDLATLQLSSYDTIMDELKDIDLIAPEGFLFYPGEYIVLSENTIGVSSFYNNPGPEAFWQMEDFPAYNNNDGIVVLSRISDGMLIDKVVYSSSMHYALLNSFKGISLERIHYDRPSDDKTNWNSAASSVGYATPGYRNSQFSPVTESSAGTVTISPEMFSPDNDGYEDVVSIAYEFESPGFTGSITIYDSNGRLVKRLVRNQLLGMSGVFSWNGINEENEKARIGIYIVYLDAFTLDGKTAKIKKTCVLAGRL